jgi:hypothetical protein
VATARLVAAMAMPGLGSLAFWARVSRLAGPGASCLAAYLEDPESGSWGIHYAESSTPTLRPPLGPGLLALVAAPGERPVCAAATVFPRNGSTVSLYIAAPGPVSREAVVTANPPAPSRRSPRAVAALLARRLLEREGVGYTRLAARLAKLLGGEAALLALVERRGPPAPLVYYASTRGVCAEATGAAAAAYGGACRPPGVLHARPQAGAVRVEYTGLKEALRS